MQNSENGNGEEWLSISDLMSGLMLIFLLIAITFMYQQSKKFENQINYKERIEEISKNYMQKEKRIYEALKNEFSEEELEKWQVEILPSNIVRFKSPNVLFERGSSELKPLFQYILSDFFPRYTKVLTTSREFREFIDEVRVEGHTDSSWNDSEFSSYLKNLELSQIRSKNVLNYIIKIPEVRSNFHWLKQVFRANGLSSSKTLDENSEYTAKSGLAEDPEKSRRVEFRIMTKSREALAEIEKLRREQTK
jgi:chemotaxis protein MotB